jgi:hypothetical protein
MPAKFGWREAWLTICICLSFAGAACGDDGGLTSTTLAHRQRHRL